MIARSAARALRPERDHWARSTVRRSLMIALIRSGAGTPWTSISISPWPEVDTATVPTPKIREDGFRHGGFPGALPISRQDVVGQALRGALSTSGAGKTTSSNGGVPRWR